MHLFTKRSALEIAFLCAVLALLAAACSPPGSQNLSQAAESNVDDDKVRVGVVGAFSGPLSYVGDAVLAGATYAVDVENEKGGALGSQVEIVSCDGQFQPATEKTCLTKLISQDAVDAVILDDPTLAFVEPGYLKSIDVPVMLPVLAPEDLDPTTYPNTFGVEPLGGSLELLTKHLVDGGFERFGVVAADDEFFSTVEDEFNVELEKAGHTPVAVEHFNSGDIDLTSQVRALADADADVMVLFGLGADAAHAVKAAEQLDYQPQIAGTETLYMSAYRELGQDATNDTLLTLPNPGDASSADPSFVLWLFEFYDRYGVNTISVGDAVAPDYPGLEVPAFELTKAVLTAMQKARTTETGAVAVELETNAFDGVSREIEWDVDSHLATVDPASEVYMARFRDGHVLFDVDPRAVPALEEARVALEAWAFSQDLSDENLDIRFAAKVAERFLHEIESRHDDIVAQAGQERYDSVAGRIRQAVDVAGALAEQTDREENRDS